MIWHKNKSYPHAKFCIDVYSNAVGPFKFFREPDCDFIYNPIRHKIN